MAEDRSRHRSVLAVVLPVAAILVLMAGVGTRMIDMHFLIGPWFLHHWISWAGALFIAVYTPVFYVLKRRDRSRYEQLLTIHVFGGLIAIALVSLHFTQHVTRPAEFYPDLGTGIVLYAGMALSLLTGVLIYLRLAAGGMREWRLVHVGAAGAFYLAIGVHVLQGLGFL